jgi:quinolinate synthase
MRCAARKKWSAIAATARPAPSSSSPKAACCIAWSAKCRARRFIPGPTGHCACADCRYMKLNTLQKLHDCLRDLTPRVEMPEDLRQRAEKPILRMLELSR